MGLTYKENVPDTRELPVRETVKELKGFGIDVYGYDLLLSKEEIEDFGVKALDFSFSTNFSLKKNPLLKKNPFLAQVLSLERKCFVKRKSVLMFMDVMDCFILHTGQHYSYNSDKIFFNGLELPEVKYNLDVGSGSHAEETGEMLIGIDKR